MSHKSPQSEEALFAAALQLGSEAERLDYLKAQCGSDEALRDSLLGLLQGYEAGRPLDDAIPVEGMAGTLAWPGDPLAEGPGRRIGRYKLLQQIGEGGFGVVYLAEQQEPVVRKVALKVIKLGMDTRQVIARFEAERQALALMDHPNIARVLDAGATETGRPFFVMELVTGVPITRYCEEAELDTNGRLELFVAVCLAVQHAHQKGIIHRDLKPSNVMVTLHDGVPVPKVIDFGVSKALNQRLTEKTLFTNYAQMVGTPAYMSPEQAEMSGLDIDTRCDVYSLGVLLYELLTGSTPHDATHLRSLAYGEMQRVICEENPPKPSTRLTAMQQATTTTGAQRIAVTAIARDLDWVVMKALEKDRRRRYETANEFAQDIRHFLGDEPVTAAAPSVLYKWRKLARRNRLAVSAAAAVAAAVVIALVVSTRSLIEANRQTERSVQVATVLKALLRSVGPSVAQGQKTVLLDHAAKNLADLSTTQPGAAAELRHVMGLVYIDLGEYPKAESVLKNSLATRQAILGDDDPATLRTLSDLARVQRELGQVELAVENGQRAVDRLKRVLPADHRDVLEAMHNLAISWKVSGRDSLALDLKRQVLTECRRTLGTEDLLTLRAINSLAVSLTFRDQEKLALLEEAHQHSDTHFGHSHPFTLFVAGNVLMTYLEKGESKRAVEMAEDVLATSVEVCGEHHIDTGAAVSNVAVCYAVQGRITEAAELGRKALAIFRSQKKPLETYGALRALGTLSAQLGDWSASRDYHEAMIATQNLNPPGAHIDWLKLAALHARLADHEAHETFSRRCLDQFENSEEFGERECAAKAALLIARPTDSECTQRAIALARNLSPDSASAAADGSPWAALCRGIAEYRARNYKAASSWLAEEKFASAPDACRGTAFAFHAMTANAAGHKNQATLLLTKAEALIDPETERENWKRPHLVHEFTLQGAIHWQNHLIATMALEEARAAVSTSQ